MPLRAKMPSFTYVGKVKGKPRPKFSKAGHAYTPKEYRGYEEAIAERWRSQVGCFFDGAICVEVKVYRPLPESRPKSVEMEYDTFKPDADNIGKAVLDALNGVAFADDKQVVSLLVQKEPRLRGMKEQMIVSVYSAE